jgi:hypothetical protein
LERVLAAVMNRAKEKADSESLHIWDVPRAIREALATPLAAEAVKK